MSATYTPQQWADNDPTKPLSAARMAYIEAGIAALVTAINALPDPTAAAQTLITALNLGSAATHPASDFDTPAARTAAITAAINNLVGAAPGALDTIYELAAQMQSDESAATALASVVAGKMPNTKTAVLATGLAAADLGAATTAALAALAAPSVTISPSSGAVGTVFTAAAAGLSSVTYQWRRDGTAISGATSASYTTVSGDSGHVLTCSASGTPLATSTGVTVGSGGAAVGWGQTPWGTGGWGQ